MAVRNPGFSPSLHREPPWSSKDALVDAAVAGDATALCALLRELAPEVARVSRAILGPHDMGLEDAIQDGLVSVMHALPGFRRDCSIHRYANRIAARTALLARSRTRAARERETRFSLADQPATFIDGRQYLDLRRKAFVHRMFDELPEAQAAVLALRFLLGYSLQEISEAVGAPINTVRSRIRLAKEAMRAYLEDEPDLLRSPHRLP
jgi:RNA polymerase sigma-70 factor (ECF subfamily)